MRSFILLFLLCAGLVSSMLTRYNKEALRALPDKMRQERLARELNDLVEEVIRHAMMARFEYRRTICDSNQFFADDVLKDFSDNEITSGLKFYLVDLEINITRTYCSNCVRNGYSTKENARILLVEW
jgi:hypothetical protein